MANDLIGEITKDIETHAAFRAFEGQIGDGFDEAYEIQDRVVEALIGDGTRGPVCGYKIALNAKPLMEMFGVSEPVSGQLFEDQKFGSPANLSASDYRSLLIEPEIAALMATDLPALAGGHDRESVLSAIEKFVPAFELVDMRDAHIPGLKLPSAIAQNMTNEGLVIGGPGLPPADLDVDALNVVVTYDDDVVAELNGAAPQHPLDAVAWLANHLAARGKNLKAGMIVLCGSHMPPKPVGSANRICAAMGVLGAVEFTVR